MRTPNARLTDTRDLVFPLKNMKKAVWAGRISGQSSLSSERPSLLLDAPLAILKIMTFLNHQIPELDWVEVTNAWSERQIKFLVQRVGLEKIIECRALLGRRKAYPLNLARLLGVKMPDDLVYLPAIEAKARLDEMRRRLGLPLVTPKAKTGGQV